MYEALFPVLTLVLGQLLGYWFAMSQTKRRIVAEKRAEYVRRFIGQAYHNRQYLATRERAGEGLETLTEFSILANQAAFFLSDRAGKAVNELTGHFALALLDRNTPTPENPDAWKAYDTELDKVRALLRLELKS